MKDKIIYWISTGIVFFMSIMSAVNFLTDPTAAGKMFESLGFSDVLVYPLSIAKILGVVAIATKLNKTLKNLAYVGFAIDFLAAVYGHLMAGDGNFPGAMIALFMLIISFIYDKKVFGK